MRSLIILLLFCGFALTISHGLVVKVPKVLTSLGPILGTYEKSYHGRKYAAFRGVPYAKPPIGSRRFEVFFGFYMKLENPKQFLKHLLLCIIPWLLFQQSLKQFLEKKTKQY